MLSTNILSLRYRQLVIMIGLTLSIEVMQFACSKLRYYFEKICLFLNKSLERDINNSPCVANVIPNFDRAAMLSRLLLLLVALLVASIEIPLSDMAGL